MFSYDLDLAWGISLQSMGNWTFAPMNFFSFLDTEEFYILILPILCWCINSTLGLHFGVVILFSSGINSVLKIPFHGPRPY